MLCHRRSYFLRRMLRRGVASYCWADALPLQFLLLLCGCFAAISTFVADASPLPSSVSSRRMLGRHGLFSSGCFATVVTPASLTDALLPKLLVFPRFFPEKAAMLADRVIGELVKVLKITPVPVVFASFSGGPKGCTYKVLQLIERRCEGQLNLDEYQLVRDCLCGQMYDSSPVDFVSDLGTRYLLNPSVLKMSEPPRVLSWMTKGIASGLDILFINKFEEQRKDYWETLYSSVHFGPILILCSEDDQLATYSVVQNFGQHLLELGGDVNVIKWHSSPHVGHYKFHPGEYRAAVTELLKKASVLYMSRRQLNGYDVSTSEHNDTPPSTSNLPRTAASSVGRLRRAPIDPTDQFFLPSSMEYHESSEGPQPELLNMPSLESLSLHGVLGQVLYDVCVPKNVEGWDLKPSASMNGRHIHTAAPQHGSFNPMKCVRRSRL